MALVPERALRRIGGIDHRDDRLPDPPGHADFLVALEQRIVERTVGIGLALEDVVLYRLRAFGLNLALGLGDPRGKLRLGLLGREELPAQLGALGSAGAASFGIDRGVEPLDPGLQLTHRGVVGFEDLRFLVVLCLQFGALLDQIAEVGSLLGRELGRGVAERLFGSDPPHPGLVERFAEAGQIRLRQRAALGGPAIGVLHSGIAEHA
jgi:hypothetical protein